MSLFNCIRQEPQPWMMYPAKNMITFNGDCCSQIITVVDVILPFQIISSGDYIKAEISEYGSDVWTDVILDITTVFVQGSYIHSHMGSAVDMTCGMYEFRVTAGEMWWFEPFTVDDFEIDINTFTKRDELMLPLKFADQQIEGIPLIAPCDSILPFMFSTPNATSGSVTVYLYDVNCDVTEVLDITVDILTIGGKTYYIHDGAILSEFLECGIHKIEIVDGTHSYFSVWFDVECGTSDIPDGYRALRDVNGCVMRDEYGTVTFGE